MSRYISVKNGKKGGRPKAVNDLKIELSDFKLIILTPNQYGTLLEKYGYELLYKALLIFESWLKSSPDANKYKGKNNYAHFRSDGWVLNAAKSKV